MNIGMRRRGKEEEEGKRERRIGEETEKGRKGVIDEKRRRV